ncbi:MAG: hypothetical protein PHG96_10410, partial [Kiritimatiellae bacterium]|nr:hypothetical protein [Kiritimatiellia bacterium]
TFNTWWVQNNPVLTNDTALGGMPVLDFGIKGSSRGLVFNAVEATDNCNRLDGIGSIIAVWHSARGTGDYGEGGYYGGQFVGGGYSFAGGTDGIMWGRDTTTQARQVDAESGSYRPRWFDNTFFQASHTHLANQNAVVRHDGACLRSASGSAWPEDGRSPQPSRTPTAQSARSRQRVASA